MAQKLIMPLNRVLITAGYKSGKYLERFGFPHYGIDFVDQKRSDYKVWGSGEGKVIASGADTLFGNVVVIQYNKVVVHNGRHKGVHDLIVRYFHLKGINVKAGDKVTTETRIGYYGNTGRYSVGAHLHLEADTDTMYPLLSPTGNGSIVKRGNAGEADTTSVDPMDFLRVDADGVHGFPQVVAFQNQGYVPVNDQATFNLKDKIVVLKKG